VSPVDLSVDVLAVARLTRLITEDEITEPMRDFIQGRWQGSKLAYLVTCPFCVSVWMGLLVTRSPIPPWVKRTLACSEATILVRQLADG
jgi:hypothetical protein